MMELEKSIVYLKASLKMNERIVKKLTGNASSLKKYIEDEGSLGRYTGRNPTGH